MKKLLFFIACLICWSGVNAQVNNDVSREGLNHNQDLFKNAPKTKRYSFGDTLKPQDKTMRYGEKLDWEREFPVFSDMYRRDFDSLKVGFRDLSQRLNQGFRNFNREVMNIDGFSNVNVFTNKPLTHIINIGFSTVNEGNITLSVIDDQGNNVYKEILKNVNAEYMGQIKLKQGSKGTYFVIISQDGKAISRKVKLE